MRWAGSSGRGRIPLIDDVPVWSILCFLVRPGYRRRGVTKALLEGAIRFAGAAGAPALEAYPIDAEGQRLDVTLSYVGFTSTFEAAGFRRVVETAGKSAGRPRWLMRLELDPGGEPQFASTTSKSEPVIWFSSWRSSSFQCELGAPVTYQGEPLSARIMPYS